MSYPRVFSSLCSLTLALLSLAAYAIGEVQPPPVDYAFSHHINEGDSEALIVEKAAKTLPRPCQSEWMRLERTFFIHFGPNTFRGVEWGDGRESPSLFNPSALDAGQWADAVSSAGGKLIILVAKHHDGLCLWPSRYTTHSVAASPWKQGKGNLVREMADAARARGLRLGIYLSPADLHQLRTNPSTTAGYYGNGSPRQLSTIPTDPQNFLKAPLSPRTPAAGAGSFTYQVDDYNRYFLNQLYELLTEYGPLSAVWFDGANPDPSVAEAYDYAAWYDLIRKLQPNAVISVKGPDVRWVGNEGGHGRTTEWSVLPLADEPSRHSWPDRQELDLGSRAKLTPGSHLWWYPAEVNTSILNGWFWSADKRAKSPAELVDYFYRSVGRNGNMLLNLCPDTRGLIPDDQLASLRKASAVLRDTFVDNLALGARLEADSSAPAHAPALSLDGNLDSWWEAAPGHSSAEITLQLPSPRCFDVLSLQEAVDQRGQRIESFSLETWDGKAWSSPGFLEELTTVGHRRLARLAKPVTTDRLRLRITKARLEPSLAELGLFRQSLPKEPAISERGRDGLVQISHPHGLPLVYTLDGSEPTTGSPRYQGPIALPKGGNVKAAVLSANAQLGLVASKTFIGLSPTGWRVVGVAQSSGLAETMPQANAIDADAASCWREQASRGDAPRPALTVDLGSLQALKGFAYLPRQDWEFIGIVDRYRFETSVDGVHWSTQIADGLFGNIRNNPMLQEVLFPSTVRARFFRFTALHDVDDNGWVGAAELTVLPAPDEPVARLTSSLDDNWRFHLGALPAARSSDFDDHSWRRVDVPHDYVVEGSFAEKNPKPEDQNDPAWYWLHGFLPSEPAVYRRSLELPASLKGRRLWLEFDGVFSDSRYWLNGREIGRQHSGYLHSRFDITEAATPGASNVLVVEVTPRYDGWWYEGGGIYRHVRLVCVDPVHLAPDGLFVMPELIQDPLVDTPDALVKVEAQVCNTGTASASVSITNTILSAEGEVLAEASSTYELGISSAHVVKQQIHLAHARLWSPASPSLYELRTTVSREGAVVDRVSTRFGVRHLRFDAERGFLLNGRPLKLQGVNLHQDHAGVGVAMPDRLFTWRLERLKEVGCNAIRMSHNPVSPFLLDECDRLGFLVIAENRHLGDSAVDQTPKDARAVAHRDVSALVLRDRNHPCIFLWSLCNEQWIQGSPEAAALARAMRERVRELDPSRPVTAAMNGGFDAADGLGGALDVIGINYNPWVYDSVHKLFPGKPLIASEIASEICTRGIYATDKWEDYHGDRERGYVSAYSISAGPAGQTVENAWPPVAARDFLGGAFVWAAFDYKGEPRPFSWPVINCHYGFMDLCGFPKDSYYYYKAQWTTEPVLHLFPHWNWAGLEGREIPVWVHTNCEQVELFLNGVSLGRKSPQPGGHLEWRVPYAPGKLLAKGILRGQALECERETTGQPAALRLTADRTDIATDNADLSVVKVEVIDQQGRLVPTANLGIRFSLTGPARLLGLGNGDPSSHEPDKSDRRSTFNGLAQALLQATQSPGPITLRAECAGLTPAVLSLKSQ